MALEPDEPQSVATICVFETYDIRTPIQKVAPSDWLYSRVGCRLDMGSARRYRLPLSCDRLGASPDARASASPGETVRNGCWTVLLLVGSAMGCTLPAHVKGPSWVEGLRSGAVVDPTVVMIETALIERPIGDSYINRELWQDTDEAFLGLTLREALHENGLRVGQIVGAP